VVAEGVAAAAGVAGGAEAVWRVMRQA